MGRPLKQGMDYYPLDVDFVSDEKVQMLAACLKDQRNATLVAAGFLTILWGRIYKKGTDPFILDQPTKLYLCRLMRMSPERFQEMVEICLNLGIFLAEPWQIHGRLVSRRIESTMTASMEERERKRKYWDAKRGGDTGGESAQSSSYKSSNGKKHGSIKQSGGPFPGRNGSRSYQALVEDDMKARTNYDGAGEQDDTVPEVP